MTVATFTSRSGFVRAVWRQRMLRNQGLALDCKSVKTGSIPVPASKDFNRLAASLLWPLPRGKRAGNIPVPFLFWSGGENRTQNEKMRR